MSLRENKRLHKDREIEVKQKAIRSWHLLLLRKRGENLKSPHLDDQFDWYIYWFAEIELDGYVRICKSV